jgi:NhaP-type Na+/H+ or K+/H+ antiporter
MTMGAHELLLMMGLVVTASIATQILAAWLRLPAIVFLLGMGILLGPEVLNLVQPAELGTGLRVLIPLMVAIILFEGGMGLDLNHLRGVSQAVRNLITVGAAMTAVLAALLAWLLTDLAPTLAILFGALVSVTGPTVINPLLRRTAVTQRLKTTLMAEGVFIDAVGAVLAVVVLEWILSRLRPWEGAWEWAIRVGGGTLIGLAGGWLLAVGLQRIGRTLSADMTRLSALGGVIAIYTLAEALSPEAGIAAAAVAGMVVGNRRFPHEEQVHHLKGDLTLLGIGVIFILLAARLRFADLSQVGWGGVTTVLLLMLVIRPLTVWVSTWGTSLTRRERLFIAGVGPRGIVAASFATFAALRLDDAGVAGGQVLVGLVFMLIIVTVVVQSFTTPWLAKMLGVQPMLTMIIGADTIGRQLAQHLNADGEETVLIDRDPTNTALARRDGLTAFDGDATDAAVLRRAGIGRATRLVAATSSDKTNLLVGHMARTRFGITTVVARVNESANIDTFQEGGMRAMSPTATTVMVLDNLLRRPSTLRLLTDEAADQEVREVVVENRALVGKPLRTIPLNAHVLIAVLRRDGTAIVPDGATMLALGDEITVIGARDAVTAVAAQCTSGGRPRMDLDRHVSAGGPYADDADR